MSPRTRLDLLRTMEELLMEHKFEDITINDICKKTLITRSTFYRYFDDKYELVESTLEYIGSRDLQHQGAISFFDELDIFIIKNRRIIKNLNPANQSHLNFYSDFLKIVENGLVSYINNDEVDKNDVIIAVVNQSKDRVEMIKFISGGLAAFLIDTDNFEQYKIDIKFLKSVLEKLAVR